MKKQTIYIYIYNEMMKKEDIQICNYFSIIDEIYSFIFLILKFKFKTSIKVQHAYLIKK